MESQINPATVRKVFLGYLAAIVLIAVYLVAYGVVYSRNTGILEVKTNRPTAAISISRADREASIVGTGSAKVRLESGVYQLVASNAGTQVTQTILITKQQRTVKTVNLTEKSEIPSVLNVDFSNTDSLKDGGLTSPQVRDFQQQIYDYKSSAKRVVIDSGSVNPGPHNPNDPNASFTLNFDLSIDGEPYKASLSYTDTLNVRTLLMDGVGNPVYDSEANQAD